MSEYPEHDRIRALGSDSQTAGEFLDWLLQDKGYTLCEWRKEVRNELPDGYYDTEPEGQYPIYTTTEKLLYEFFGIDADKIEQEKRHMLEECRKSVESKA